MRRELVDTKREREAAEADYERMGWEVVGRSTGRTVVERGRRGSWGWHILYFLLVPIVGNLIYSAYRRYDRPKQIVIRTHGGPRRTRPAPASRTWSRRTPPLSPTRTGDILPPVGVVKR